ncbi:hypothetical protein C8R46DRAFT_1192613 [Mycena filopes]|nr:hypothetical protein C8R46DRAFT_1192613 [Mycena filopes]
MPSSKAPKHAAEANHILQEKLDAAEKIIESYKRRDAARATASKQKKLIPRPVGQPGRSSGYNLQGTMKLAKDAVHYRRLYRIVKDVVHQRLEVEKTITEQDKRQLQATIIHISKLAPIFQGFAGLWPIRIMIRVYLSNMGTRRRNDLALENAWTKSRKNNNNDGDGDESEDGDGDGDGEDGDAWVDMGNDEEEDDDVEMDPPTEEEDEEFPASIPVRRKVTFVVESEGEEDNDSASVKETAPANGKDPKTKVKKVIPTKRKSATSSDDQPAAKKTKPDRQKASTSHSKAPTPKILTWADLPSECPTVLCDETLPEQPNDRILSLFQRLKDLKAEVGRTGRGVAWLKLELCGAITEENKREDYLQLGAENGWPLEIDYDSVFSRILDLEEPILEMIKDRTILEDSVTWKLFLANINNKIFEFSNKSKSKYGFPSALSGRRCGYYGPKGEFVIMSTITRMLAEDDEQLELDLCTTLSAIVDDAPQNFDTFDPASNLIALEDFIPFVLVPFVALLLISEDQDIAIADALKIQKASNTFGNIVHPDDDDDVIHEIHRKNLRAMRQSSGGSSSLSLPSRSKPAEVEDVPASKKSKKTKPVAPKPSKALTVNDFEEPKARGKKVRPRAKPKTKKAPAVPVEGGYGTRSKSRAV